MRLTSTGLGIGTSSPRSLLDLNSTRSVKAYWGTAGTLGETQSTAGDYVANSLYVSAESAGLMTYTKTTNDSGNAILQDFSRGITFYTGVTGNSATTGTLNTFERLRITAAGSVGIGTTSPNATLNVVGITRLARNGLNLSIANAANTTGMYIETDSTGNILKISNNGGTERARIDSSGNLLVGTTSSTPASSNVTGTAILVFGGAQMSRTNSITLDLNRDGSDGAILNLRKGGTTVGSISVTASATAYNTSSDYRLKEDWVAVSNASTRVNALKPVNFAWKADGSRVDGFLAHELAEVVPEAVTGTKDAMRDEEYEVTPAVLDDEGAVVTPAAMGTRSVPDYQGIDQSKLVPLLTAALQEALAAIESLTARISALEGV